MVKIWHLWPSQCIEFAVFNMCYCVQCKARHAEAWHKSDRAIKAVPVHREGMTVQARQNIFVVLTGATGVLHLVGDSGETKQAVAFDPSDLAKSSGDMHMTFVTCLVFDWLGGNCWCVVVVVVDGLLGRTSSGSPSRGQHCRQGSEKIYNILCVLVDSPGHFWRGSLPAEPLGPLKQAP